MQNISVSGITGPVVMNSNGDRAEPEYLVLGLQQSLYRPVLVWNSDKLRPTQHPLLWPGDCRDPVYRKVIMNTMKRITSS